MSSRFSIIPARAIDDARLSRPALVVLCALGVYGNKGGWCRPSQSTLAKRLGVSRQAVGKSISELAELGYIEKRRRFGEDGSEIPCLYRILFDAELPQGADRHPENDMESLHDEDLETNPLQPTVAPPATSEVAPPATSEVAPPATSEVAQTPHYNAPLQRPNSTPHGNGKEGAIAPSDMPEVTPECAAEYIAYRKAKKAPLTPRAWKRIVAEIDKAGLDREGALGYAMSRGWTGFDADWVRTSDERRDAAKAAKAAQPRGGKLYGRALEEENARVLRAFVDGSDVKSQPDLAFIEGIFSHEKH